MDVLDPPSKVGATLRRLGPGLIIAGSIVGSGELIATTKVGAQAGYLLLWLILIGCVIKVFTQVELGRATVIDGRTALESLDLLPGPRWRAGWAVWLWLVMTVLTVGMLGGIVGGVGQALAIAKPLTEVGREFHAMQDELVGLQVQLALDDDGTQGAAAARLGELETALASATQPHDDALWAALIAVPTAVVLMIGRFGLIQALSTILVAAFTLMTGLTVVLLQFQPDWAIRAEDLVQGLSFRLPGPELAAARAPIATALAAFGIIGVGAAELIMYPYWCLEKGYARWTGPREATDAWRARARGWMRVLRWDAWLSAWVYTFATVAFYLLGAAVLGRSGLNPERDNMVRTLAEMYVPVFGGWASTVFLIGAFAVLYSTFFVASASLARVMSDAVFVFGLIPPSEVARAKWTRIFCGLLPLVCLAVFVFVRAPVQLVLAGGIAQASMLPVLGFAALWLRYRRCDPALAPGKLWDVMLWLSFAGFLVAGSWAILSKLFPTLLS